MAEEKRFHLRNTKRANSRFSNISPFTQSTALMKLRLALFSIFVLSTIGFVLVVYNLWSIGAFLVLLSYIIVLVLLIKLLLIKHL